MDTIYYYIVYTIILAAVCVRILFNTNSPSKTAAYIFLVVTIPFFGIALYFSFGDNYRKKKLYIKKLGFNASAYPELENQITSISKNTINKHKNTIGNFFPLANYRNAKSFSTDNNEVTLFINGEEKFPDVIASLKKAKKHIHIEYYVFEEDAIGTEIGNILIEKAKEGVKVRFIYDDYGSKSIRKKFIKRLKNAGVEAVPFYKINVIQFANRMNYRNHRKIIIIDAFTGYVGGINISDKYINTDTNEWYWRDTHLKIVGGAVLNLQHIFLTDWNFCSGQNIAFSHDFFPIKTPTKSVNNQFVQIISSGPDSKYSNIMFTLIQAILLSKKEILLTTPYFIPDKSFLDALKIAALSGIKIKILVPGVSDSYIVNTASHSYYQEILELDIEVYKYQKGFVHAKTMVCDGHISFVGTANLDNRSFDLNFEVNALVYDKRLSEQLVQNFHRDIQHAEQLTLEQWKNRPMYEQLFERIINLFSALM